MKEGNQQREKDPKQFQSRATEKATGSGTGEWVHWVGLLELLLLELRLWEIAVLEGSSKPGAVEWLFGEGVERLLRYGRKVECCLARAEAGAKEEESFRAKGKGSPCREKGGSISEAAPFPGATEEGAQLSSLKEKSPEERREREVWSDSLLAEGEEGTLQGELLDRLRGLRELEWAVRGVPTEIRGRLQPQIDEVIAHIHRLARWRWFGLSRRRGTPCP